MLMAWVAISPASLLLQHLYDIGFNYFFRGSEGEQEGDLVFFQGHIAPGIYSRAYLEGRLTEEQMDNYRREVDGYWSFLLPTPLADA